MISVPAYVLGFHLLAARIVARLRSFERIGLDMHRRSFKDLVRSFLIVLAGMRYWLWKRSHPHATFADFYATTIARRLDHGGSHRTLGKKRYFGEDDYTETDFQLRGHEQFTRIKALGVEPHDLCIDYGCGSLRVGQHFIHYLDRGKYWGLDITDRFFIDGLDLLSDSLIAAKAPRTDVISHESLEKVKAAGPDVIFSTAVLQHVPPEELDVYLGRVLGLMAPHAMAAIVFKSGRNGRRVRANSWSYDACHLAEAIARLRPGARIEFVEYGNTSKSRAEDGRILVVRRAVAAV